MRRLNQSVGDKEKPSSSPTPPSGILKSRGSPSSPPKATNTSVRFNPEAPMFHGDEGQARSQPRPAAHPHKSTLDVERPRPQLLPKKNWTYAGPAQGGAHPAPRLGHRGDALGDDDFSKMASRILNIKAKERRRMDAGHTPRLVLSPGAVQDEPNTSDYLFSGGAGEESTSESETEREAGEAMGGYRLAPEGYIVDEDKALTGPLMLRNDGEHDGGFLKGVVDRLAAVEREQREESR